MNIEDIKNNVKNNKYTVKMEYPKRPEGYKKENYVYDEEKSVRWNREHQEELTNEYIDKLNDYHKETSRIETEFVEDLITAIKDEYKFTEIQATNIYKLAWEDGHSDGLETVISYVIYYADFTQSQLKNVRHAF
ncbi:hypothetical protein [uncultured Clostridium sp.]|uniref:hypothetical protein n=1 Tax=uncultured Clostridium sp. TaxID=59620 RepID=UPI0026ED3BF9|nr:hypothetical protein [uncultured Clostridium sp.]